VVVELKCRLTSIAGGSSGAEMEMHVMMMRCVIEMLERGLIESSELSLYWKLATAFADGI
ncbi:hypothetical protein C5167_046449, partial [Papaver somniferum]